MSGPATIASRDAADPHAPASSRDRTLREVMVFLVLTLGLSTLFYAYLFRTGRWNSRIAHLFMWCPGLGALGTRLLFARTLRGLGWGWSGSRAYLLPVLALPFLLCLAVYLPVWFFGLGAFDPAPLRVAADRIGLAGPLGSAAILGLGVVLAPVAVALGSVWT